MLLYSELLIDHFRNPRKVGTLPAPAVTVDATNPACGDWLQLSIEWEGDRANLVRYRVRGCTASIAAGSAMAEWAEGRRASELAQFGPTDLEAMLGEMPSASRHALSLCVDALRLSLARRPV